MGGSTLRTMEPWSQMVLIHTNLNWGHYPSCMQMTTHKLKVAVLYVSLVVQDTPNPAHTLYSHGQSGNSSCIASKANANTEKAV
jgi:hypothetical protein